MSHKKNALATIVITIITTSIFSFVFLGEAQRLREYLGHSVEDVKSALFFEEFINQKIASQLTKNFSSQNQKMDNIVSKDTCNKMEKVGKTFDSNLTKMDTQNIDGSLLTRNPDCKAWIQDLPALSRINEIIIKNEGRFSFSNHKSLIPDGSKYYIDLIHSYIYANKPIDESNHIFNTWLPGHNQPINIKKSAKTIGIDDSVLQYLFDGESIRTRIYKDGYTKQSVISIITPVFDKNDMKGLFITDINTESLAKLLSTNDRQLPQYFLDIHAVENTTGENTLLHKPIYTALFTLDHKELIGKYYTLYVKLDYLYILISNAWLIISYILSTIVICKYTNKQFARHASLSKDNVTDSMTGLYNRKIITPNLQEKIQSLIVKDIAVTVIAIDCDGLKRINDDFGHHIGDKVIKTLGQALATSIRNNDYGIRLGGDEFILILINNTFLNSQKIISRIYMNLASMDKDKLVNFSYGSYQLKKDDSLEEAFRKADSLLYQHKFDKYSYLNAGSKNRI